MFSRLNIFSFAAQERVSQIILCVLCFSPKIINYFTNFNLKYRIFMSVGTYFLEPSCVSLGLFRC